MIMKSCTPLLCQWLIEWLCRQLTWMDLLGCRRREKREERREKREEKLLVVLSLPSLAIPLTSHYQNKAREGICDSMNAPRTYTMILKEEEEEIREEEEERRWKRKWHTWDDLGLYLSVHLRQQVTCAVHWSSTCTQRKKKSKWGEVKRR